jgi:hypothetical protein
MSSPPGRCWIGALIVAVLLALLAIFAGDARAEPKKKPDNGGQATTDPKTGQKTKSYTFTGLDIDGKLKTPQLLYFLNRMKSEFDTTTPDKRSFIPELKRSTDEM